MSQIQFVKEGIQQYMAIDIEGELKEDYESKLMQYHTVPGFMPYEIRELNGKRSLYYRLVYRTRVEDAMSRLPMNTERACGIVSSIVEMLKSCEEYLLDTESVMYDTDYIFMDVTSGRLIFAYCPEGNDTGISLKELLTKLMQYTNKKYEESMVILLKFYNLVTDPDCTIEKLEDYCRSKGIEKLYNNDIQSGSADDVDGYGSIVGESDKDIYADVDDNIVISDSMGNEKSRSPQKTRSQKKLRSPKKSGINKKERRSANSANNDRNGTEKYRSGSTAKRILRKIIIGIMGITAVFDLVLLAGLLLNMLTYEKTGYLFVGMAVLIGLTIIYMGLDDENVPEHIMEEYYNSNETNNKDNISTDKYDNGTDYGYINNDSYYGYDNNSNAGSRDGDYGDKRVSMETVLLTSEEVNVSETIVEETSPGMLYLESLVKDQYEPLHVKSGNVVVGSMEDGCDYLLKARGISRLHAKLMRRDDGMYLSDLNSTNGTYINGDQLDVGVDYRLEEGDMVAFAGSRFFVAKEE